MATDLERFAHYSAEIQSRLSSSTPNPWDASPFGWITKEPSRRRGMIAEQLIAAWVVERGFSVRPAANSGHDLIVEALKVEVKFSSLWASGVFKFQQLRDQDYEVAVLLGLEPQEVRAWIPTKDLLRRHVLGNPAAGQHTGRDAADTFWISFRADRPPSWLAPTGGTLDDAEAVLGHLCHR
jgi:hypothetical protein